MHEQMDMRDIDLPDDHHFPLGQLLPGPQVVQEADGEHKRCPAQHKQHQQHKKQPQSLAQVCVLQHTSACKLSHSTESVVVNQATDVCDT